MIAIMAFSKCNCLKFITGIHSQKRRRKTEREIFLPRLSKEDYHIHITV